MYSEPNSDPRNRKTPPEKKLFTRILPFPETRSTFIKNDDDDNVDDDDNDVDDNDNVDDDDGVNFCCVRHCLVIRKP